LIRIVFGVIAGVGLLMALGTVLARNLVHAALFLVAFFFLVACQFILLEAEFLAAMQVLVYIGAVAILLLFGIMLTRNIRGDETTRSHWVRTIPAAVAAVGLLVVLLVGIGEEKGLPKREGLPERPSWTETKVRPELKPDDPREPTITNMGRAVGDELMTRFAVAFEVAGLLLTAAVVGAVAIAMGEGSEETARRGARPGALAAATGGPSPNGSGSRNIEALTTPRA
jgi:NADH:ubiquinone oxidoreductase subunit 6 (subunit J)